MQVTTTYHLGVGDDMSVEVLCRRADAGDVDRPFHLPDTVMLDERTCPGLVVQVLDGGNYAVALSVESLLRVAAAVEKLRRRPETDDDREVCAEHGFYARSPATFNREVLGGVHTCPRCEEERLADDAADRLKGAGR